MFANIASIYLVGLFWSVAAVMIIAPEGWKRTALKLALLWPLVLAYCAYRYVRGM